METETEYPFLVFPFEVQIKVTSPQIKGSSKPTLCFAAFAECDGLEMTMEPKVIKEGGNNRQHIHLVGAVSYGNLTLKRGMTSNTDLWDWFDAVLQTDGVGADATVVVKVLGPEAQQNRPVQRQYTLSKCLPIKFKAPAMNAKDGQIAVEELQIAYQSMELTP